ncbi:hypothetical protein GCM10027346_31170 [Hymenobacter seoulensis]
MIGLIVGGSSLSGCQDDKQNTPTPSTPPTPAPNTIAADAVTPATGAKLSAASTITATLTYALAENQRTDYIYSITAQFETTTAGTTIGTGSSSTAVLSDRAGKTSLTIPLSELWKDTRLKHPVTVYFYLLARAPGSSTSEVIAKTGAYTYTE